MENRKFKVGDKVRIKVGRFINQTGLVREDDGCNVWVSMDDTKRWLPFMEHELDLVEITLDEQETPREPISASAVNHPAHYNSHPSGIECITIARHYCFSIGNAIKYLWRAGLKHEQGLDDTEKEIQDLQKAIFYIQDRIEEIKGRKL